MAQSVVAHMQTILCPDVAHQTARSLHVASRAWSSDKENSNATQRRKIIFFGIPPYHSGCSRIRQRARGRQSNIPHPLRLWHIGYVLTQLRIKCHFFGLRQSWGNRAGTGRQTHELKKLDVAACCVMLPNPYVQLQKMGATACCGCTCLAMGFFDSASNRRGTSGNGMRVLRSPMDKHKNNSLSMSIGATV